MSERLKFFLIVFVAVWVVLLVRIYFLSIKSNAYYEELATRNMEKKEYIAPVRGQILDRFGEPLAVNELGFSLALPPGLSVRSKLSELIRSVELLVEFFPRLDKDELLARYKKQDSLYNHESIVIVEFVSYEEMHLLYPRFLQSELIKILPSTKRFYPNKTTASHIIGYTGRADARDIERAPLAKYTGIVGKSGLERQYNDFLQGELGYRRAKVTAFNQEIEILEEKRPLENNDITLTLDLRLQRILDAEFENKNGAAVVMDIHTGEILAAGSYPEYDINDFIGGISYAKWDSLRQNPHNPLLNKLINGLYPPGSVIKMGVGMALLEYAGVNERTVVDTPEFIELGGRKFRDWRVGGHGSSDLIKSIKRSVDVYYYKLSQKAGMSNIAKVITQMGFGVPTGIDLPNEFGGIVPSPEWKMRRYKQPWYIGDTIVSSIGQGAFAVTPLQVARHTALLASGKMVMPHLVKMLGENQKEYETREVLTSFQKSKLPALRLGMYQVCEEEGGTAYWYTRESNVTLACKTGTAQVVGISQADKKRIREEDMDYFHRSHAWITAYLPYENPQYVVTIMAEHGGHGGSATGSTLVKIANSLLELGYIQPAKKEK
ncbi:MAG: penicillin-binding protein 2 [Wolinella sp.]